MLLTECVRRIAWGNKWVERDGFESSSHHFGDGRHCVRDGVHDALGGGAGSTALTTEAAAAGAEGESRDCDLAAAAGAAGGVHGL